MRSTTLEAGGRAGLDTVRRLATALEVNLEHGAQAAKFGRSWAAVSHSV
jgi:hypothetical protein